MAMAVSAALTVPSFIYHGFFFVLFIQRMAPLMRRKEARHGVHASTPFVAEAAFYLGLFAPGSGVSAESLAGLFTRLGGQLFGFDPSTSSGAATALAVAQFMVLYEIGEGVVHGWVMASTVGVHLCAGTKWPPVMPIGRMCCS